MFPKDRFYQVVIRIEIEDENTGKFKKCREVHLVDAKDTNEIAPKVAKQMEGCLGEWQIVSINLSKISCVYN